jgi:hypothetical protein
MTACLRFEREGKGRIPVDIDRINRVHLDRDSKAHEI